MVDILSMKESFLSKSNQDKVGILNNSPSKELARFIITVLSYQYSNFVYYKSFRMFLESNLDKLEESIIVYLNLVFCLHDDRLETDLETFFKEFPDNDYWVQAVLAGTLRHKSDLVVKILLENTIDSKYYNPICYYLLARGYENREIECILKNIEPYALNKDRKKIKVALLVSGQIRGFQSALESWAETFDFNNCDVDIYISTWEKSGRQTDLKKLRIGNGNLNLNNKIEEMKVLGHIDSDFEEKYYAPKVITASYLEEVINENINYNYLKVDIQNEDEFIGFSNPMKLYYKINRCFNLSKKDDYDLYIRIRPDLYLENSTINLSEYEQKIQDHNCMYMHYPYVYEYYGFGVDDKLAIGKYDNMRIYSDTWLRSITHKNDMQGHVNLANNLFLNRVDTRRLPDIQVSMIDINIRN